MSDFKANYRTKAGVEVVADKGTSGYRIRGKVGWFNAIDSEVFEALFEPIPKPKMVEIPLDLARAIRADVNRACRLTLEDSSELERLISAAEQEKTQ